LFVIDVEEPAWKNTTGAQVYVTPVVGNEDRNLSVLPLNLLSLIKPLIHLRIQK